MTLFIRRYILLLGIIALAFSCHSTFGQVMQSGTYSIYSDSINSGGGQSSSASYNLGDTVGELATGKSNSSTYAVNAGFWQMQNSYLALSTSADLALPSIGGLTTSSGEGTMSWNVLTDNPAGYTLSIKATTSPALSSVEDSFSDYEPSGVVPDYNLVVPANDSVFAFSVEGNDTLQRYKDNGSVCGVGSNITSSKCWDGFSTTDKNISASQTSNQPSGTSTTLRVKAANGSNHLQKAGSYSAELIVTATLL